MADVVVISAEELKQIVTEAVKVAIAQFKPAPQREVKFLSVADVAKRLQVAPLTIYRGVKKGTIPHKMVGAKIKISSTYLEQ